MTTWTALTVKFTAAIDEMGVDVATGELFDLDAQGLQVVEGPPVTLVASFLPEHVPEVLVGRVQESLQAVGLPAASVEVSSWPDVDWSTHWRRHFRPLAFGRVWVVPNWLEPPADAEVVLRIDPGMAFGTGLHPTTALCLERVVGLSPIESMLDVGTGTGILSLAAAALGASVVATDIDPVAVEAATDNAAHNGLSHRIRFTVDEAVEVSGTYPVVVANILAEPLIRLASRLAARVANGGRLLLSGILHTQADAVEAAYRPLGFGPARVERQGEWVSLEFQAPSSASPSGAGSR